MTVPLSELARRMPKGWTGRSNGILVRRLKKEAKQRVLTRRELVTLELAIARQEGR